MRRPNRSPARPPATTSTPSDSRYPLITHACSTSVAPSSTWIAGSATRTAVTSIVSIPNAATMADSSARSRTRGVLVDEDTYPVACQASRASTGTIFAIGGAEAKLRRRSVLRAFVAEAGGSDARIAVIPSASSLGPEVVEVYRAVFGSLGAGEVIEVRPGEPGRRRRTASWRPRWRT